jgi:hypothetical protein
MMIPLRSATCARDYQEPPQVVDADGTSHWITRAANFVVVVSEATAGACLARDEQPDEYMLLLPPDTTAAISVANECVRSEGYSLTIVPPGRSRIEIVRPGLVVRIFSNRAADLLEWAGNAATYAGGAPEVAPLQDWPEPIGGFRLRHYSLAECDSPDPSPLRMRVFRSCNLMINVFMPWTDRRDETKLSPHFHEDFEQISLGMSGSFKHHLRYPWGADKTGWRDDEHQTAASPSVLVVPAGVVHTTQDIGLGVTWLIDIFGPPRYDFSLRDGFVLNADEYPMPPQ